MTNNEALERLFIGHNGPDEYRTVLDTINKYNDIMNMNYDERNQFECEFNEWCESNNVDHTSASNVIAYLQSIYDSRN